MTPSSKPAIGGARPSGLKRKVISSSTKRPVDTSGKDVEFNTEQRRKSARRTSLADRLKMTMQLNVNKSPSTINRQSEKRAVQLQTATDHMKEVQKESTEFFGLSKSVGQTLLTHKGISDLYDWQKECLQLPALQEGRNLIYSLPTSGGKTLVAEILILKELLVKRRDAMLVLPYVSIVQEKMKNLAGLAVELDFAVEEYAASKGTYPPRQRRKRRVLYVCTIEKANTLISVLIETDRISEIGLVVVDELHMLGDGDRGATLELALTKLLHCAFRTQIIGMSATLSNIGELKTFLQADLYTNDFRPVVLSEYIKVDDALYKIPCDNETMSDSDPFPLDRVLTFRYSPEMERADPDHLLGLVLEVIPNNSCLVFCPTKKNCENVAQMLCKLMSKELHHVKTTEKKELLHALKDNANASICPILKRTIPYGLAYHHSGLTMDERKLIEEAYSEGTLCALMCTSTLAAGVNLPAKRVILRSIKVGAQILSRSQYKQMTGRAGRAGIDTAGESILLVKSAEKSLVRQLVTGPCDRCQSSLLDNGAKALRTLLLSVVGLKVAISAADSYSFLSKTLSAVQLFSEDDDRTSDLRTITQTALQDLLDTGFLRQRLPEDILESASLPSHEERNGESQTVLEVTKLGRATFKSGIDITRAANVYDDLRKAQESLNVASYLHLLYLATPYDMAEQCYPSWMIYLNQFCSLSPCDQELAATIGVSESYLNKRASGQRGKQNKATDTVSRRFFLTLMLYELWQEKTVWDVAEKFEQDRGFVQNLLTGASSFAAAIHHFCGELEEFWAYQDLLGNFVKRLAFCSSADLIPLMEIPGVKQGRARQLHKAGFTTFALIAAASEEELIGKVEHLSKKVARQIIQSAKLRLKEKVESLREEAQDLMQIVMPDVTSGSDMTSANVEDNQKAENVEQSLIVVTKHHDEKSDCDDNNLHSANRTSHDNHDFLCQGGESSEIISKDSQNLVIGRRKSSTRKSLSAATIGGASVCDQSITDEEILTFCSKLSDEALFTESSLPTTQESSCQGDGRHGNGENVNHHGNRSLGASSRMSSANMDDSQLDPFGEDDDLFTMEMMAKLDPS